MAKSPKRSGIKPAIATKPGGFALIQREPVINLRKKFGGLIRRVSVNKEKLILTRRGKPVAALVPITDPQILEIEDPSFSTMEDAERWATEMATALFRAEELGDERFAATWQTFSTHPKAAIGWNPKVGESPDPCKGLFPYALSRMLRKRRQLIVDSQVNMLSASLTDPRHRQSVFEKIIGMRWKRWPIDIVGELGTLLNNEETGIEVLTVAESNYHEERVLAHFARDLFLTVHGYAGIQIRQAPWAFDRSILGGSRREKKADFRVSNKDAATRRQSSDDIVGNDVIFVHKGYRAYANGAWLASLANSKDTPPSVQNWIKGLTLARARLPDDKSLAERIWILMKGRPPRYPGTEFDRLFEFLGKEFERAKSSKYDLPQINDSDPASDPDDEFENFLLGNRQVLMGGSIHDLLLEQFWIPENMTFIKIIDRNDFAKLEEFLGEPPGRNVMLFSKRRLGAHREICEKLSKLYSELARAIVASIEQDTGVQRDALLTYIANVLGPNPRENWNTAAPDARWSFAASTDGIIQLLTNEMRLPESMPSHE